jgi:hypothetical protein
MYGETISDIFEMMTIFRQFRRMAVARLACLRHTGIVTTKGERSHEGTMARSQEWVQTVRWTREEERDHRPAQWMRRVRLNLARVAGIAKRLANIV